MAAIGTTTRDAQSELATQRDQLQGGHLSETAVVASGIATRDAQRRLDTRRDQLQRGHLSYKA
eukprot:11159524-Karenia_brevis.AAC.1